MRKCRGTPLFPVFSLPRASGQALSDIGENIDKCFLPRIILTAEKHYPRTKGYHDRKKNYAEIPQPSLFSLFMPVDVYKRQIETLNAKKRRAVDLMLDGLITQQELIEQKSYYDSICLLYTSML